VPVVVMLGSVSSDGLRRHLGATWFFGTPAFASGVGPERGRNAYKIRAGGSV
jgi:hypothetical protein